MIPPTQLSQQQADRIAQLAQIGGLRQVQLIKRQNDLYRLETVEGDFFLKTYTKTWYGDALAATAGCVQHEAAAYSILAAQGLPCPAVVLADLSLDNPLRRPFLLLRQLPGTSLVPLLQSSDPSAWKVPLERVGAYLARVHAITFAFPGYLMDARGPTSPPDENAWQHPIWSAGRAQCNALAWLEAERGSLSPALVARVEPLFYEMADILAPAYRPPHFTHGDCHAEQFFLSGEGADWRVTGCVDLEVASSGASEADLAKFALEMAVRFTPETRWWEPFFAGYGQVPDFERFRLWFLSAGEPSFRCYGEDRWPATWEATLSHLVGARNWKTLFGRP